MSDKEILPEKLQNSLTSANVKLIEVLFSNQRKGRWVLKVKKKGSNELGLFKWCSPQSPLYIQKEFQEEIDFYKQFPNMGFSPCIYQVESDWMLMEYISPHSLRDFLLTASTHHIDTNEVLTNLLKRLHTFHKTDTPGTLDAQTTAKHLTSFWLKLFLSGPMHTSRTKTEDFLAKLIAPFIKTIVYKKFIIYFNDLEGKTRGLIHGDLHCNNILIYQNNDVRLIDFESIKRNEYWMLDLLYLWPMILKLITKKEHKKKALDILHTSELFSCDDEWLLFVRCLRLMNVAIFLNRRFSVFKV